MSDTQVNPKFKDSLFRLIFRERKALLSLYNAVNGSDYQNPEELVVNTMEDVVYMGMKNDVSFLFADHLNLYEAQSTANPNMPLRGVFYFSRLYKGIVEERKLDVYSRRQINLPKPVFIVFYNGMEDQEERRVLKLSDSFSADSCRLVSEKPGQTSFLSEVFLPALECTAIMLNINYGHNRKLMERCKKLEEYAFFVEQVRRLKKQGLSLEAAADEAIRVSLDQGILTDILRKHRAEVKDLILSEYNEELHIKNEKNISYEEGHQQGLQQGLREGIAAAISICCDMNMEKAQIRENLVEKFSLSEEEAERYLEDLFVKKA